MVKKPLIGHTGKNSVNTLILWSGPQLIRIERRIPNPKVTGSSPVGFATNIK